MPTSTPLQATQQWFTQVVLGLNLCPFAHQPARLNRIKFVVSKASDDAALMDILIHEINHLDNVSDTECETTLLIAADLLGDFYDYQFFIDEANRQLKQHNWQGTFQLASFHPDYCFAGAQPSDASNLTNRSPYPINHILREASLTRVLENVENSDAIPETNIQRVENLSSDEIERLFPYLDKG
jgi:hypothetical protein